jgi:hypothetical protein
VLVPVLTGPRVADASPEAVAVAVVLVVDLAAVVGAGRVGVGIVGAAVVAGPATGLMAREPNVKAPQKSSARTTKPIGSAAYHHRKPRFGGGLPGGR